MTSGRVSGEDVAVVEQILVVVLEALAAGGRLVETVATDRRPHRAIEHQDAFAEFFFEFGLGVL